MSTTLGTTLPSTHFFELVGSNRFDLDALNTHTFAPRDCEKAYTMVNERRGETMGVVFGWS